MGDPTYYADSDDVTALTSELNPTDGSTKYTTLLDIAMADSDSKIMNVLTKNNITIPTSDEDLTQIANLYSAAFMFNIYYSSNDTTSPTTTIFTKDADTRLQNYIDIHHTPDSTDTSVLTATSIDLLQ